VVRAIVIAVGGSACRWIEAVQDDGRIGRLCVAAGGEYAALAREVDLDVVEIGAGTKPRPFCRIQEAWAVRAAQDDAELIVQKVGDAEVAVLVTDLADPFSRGAGHSITRQLKEHGTTAIVIAALPFRFGAAQEKHQAKERLRDIESLTDRVLPLNFDELVDWLPPQTSFSKAVSIAGEAMSDAIRETLGMVSQMDRDELRQALAGIDTSNFLQEGCARYLTRDSADESTAEV